MADITFNQPNDISAELYITKVVDSKNTVWQHLNDKRRGMTKNVLACSIPSVMIQVLAERAFACVNVSIKLLKMEYFYHAKVK